VPVAERKATLPGPPGLASLLLLLLPSLRLRLLLLLLFPSLLVRLLLLLPLVKLLLLLCPAFARLLPLAFFSSSLLLPLASLLPLMLPSRRPMLTSLFTGWPCLALFRLPCLTTALLAVADGTGSRLEVLGLSRLVTRSPDSRLVTDGTLGPLELLPTPADASLLLVLLPSRLLVVTVLVVPFTP